jgi:hypothetical protein
MDNCLLVGAKKADMVLFKTDVGWEGSKRKGEFKDKLPIMTLNVLCSNMHVVAL